MQIDGSETHATAGPSSTGAAAGGAPDPRPSKRRRTEISRPNPGEFSFQIVTAESIVQAGYRSAVQGPDVTATPAMPALAETDTNINAGTHLNMNSAFQADVVHPTNTLPPPEATRTSRRNANRQQVLFSNFIAYTGPSL